MGRFGSQEILLLLLIVLLLFGAARLPKLARSMREARDEFQKGSDEATGPDAPLAQERPPVAAEPAKPDAPPPAGSAVPEAHTENPEPAPTEQEK